MLNFSSVRRRARRVFRLRRPLAEYMRGVLAGATVAFAMAEAVAYQRLHAAVRSGSLPSYTIDTCIVAVSVIEGLCAPLLAAAGRGGERWSRRGVLMTAMLVPAGLVLLTLAAPTLHTPGSELCVQGVQWGAASGGGGGVEGVTLLVLMVSLALGAALARVAVFTQGLAYLDEHQPQHLLMHFGVLTAVRVLGLSAVPRLLSPSTGAGTAAAGVACPLVLHALQLLLVPRRAPSTPASLHVGDHDASVWRSLTRVLSNGGAMGPMMAAVTLAAALFGFMYHETDIINTRFLSSDDHSLLWGAQSALARGVLLLVAVVLVAKYNTPTPDPGAVNVTPLMDKPAVLKLAAQVTLAAVPLYIVLVTAIRCERGLVVLPSNSCNHCSCDVPWQRFSPVCLREQLTTHYSPCTAGCATVDLVGGLQAYRNCSCSGWGVSGGEGGGATRGACGAVQCLPAMQLFETLVLMLLALSVVAVQCLGAASVRAVQPQDRATALGVLAGLLAMFAFASTHVLYRTIADWTCEWRVRSGCELQDAWFVYATGGASATLALLSAALCLILWLRARTQQQIKVPLEAVAQAAGSSRSAAASA